jgi:hypothetical protein
MEVSIHVSSRDNENTEIFGDADSACEYVSSRSHEDFEVWLEYDYEYKRLAKEIAQELFDNLDNNADFNFDDDDDDNDEE